MAEIYGRVSGGNAGRNRGTVSAGTHGLPALHGFLPCRCAEVPEDYGKPRARGVEHSSWIRLILQYCSYLFLLLLYLFINIVYRYTLS